MASDVTITTPLMGMVLPVVGQSPGPLYAQDINAALQTVVDTHTHVPGQGAQIPPAALNVNADLPFASAGVSYRITSLKATAYTDQLTTLSAAFTAHVYQVGGDLYWNNASGTPVRITAGNALNAASIHGIGGDYGTDPNANAIYTTSIHAFTWTQSAGVAAKMAVGDLLVYDTAGGANAVTVKNPGGLAGAYTMTLPAALPANNNNTNVLAITSAGVISTTQAPQFADPKVQDGSGSFYFQIKGSSSSLAANRAMLLPVVTADDTFAMVNATQTISAKTMTGPDGTAGAPTYSFSSENNTGWFKLASNNPALAISGVTRLAVNPSTGQGTTLLFLVAPTGTGAAIAWSANANTYYPPVLAGGALGSNFSNNDQEVDCWNTYTSHTATLRSFRWLQQTGASSAVDLMALDGNGNLLLKGGGPVPTSLVGGLLFGQGTVPSATPSNGVIALGTGTNGFALYGTNGPGTNGLLFGISNVGMLQLAASGVSGTTPTNGGPGGWGYSGMAGNLMGWPNVWIAISVAGSIYKIPAYS